MMPEADFFGTRIGRLLVGDNPINGHSYVPEIWSREDMIEHYTEGNVLADLAYAEALGYTAMVPLGSDFMLRALWRHRRGGGRMKLIFQSYPPVDFQVNLRQMAELDPLGVYHQGTTTDALCEAGRYDILKDRLRMIRDAGLPAGLGTHVPETVLRAEEEGWGADFYVTCLHNTRTRGAGKENSFITGKPKHLKFFMEDREIMYRTIRAVPKPCIAFKVLAGGQIFYGLGPRQASEAARAALREAYENIKPTDMCLVGCFQRDKDQLKENAEFVQEILAGR